MNKVSWFMGLFMTVVVLGFAIVFSLTDLFIENIPKPNRTYLALMFLGYSIFRGVRVYQQFKKMKQDEKE